MIGLITPFAGIHNLDLSPDPSYDTNGVVELWGQLTPGEDASLASASIGDADYLAVRSYQSEEEMYVDEQKGKDHI